VSCPYRMDTGAYVLGVLAATDRARMREHLKSCPPCRAEIADLAGLMELLRALVTSQKDPGNCPAD
jgi:anti-sigma factor RsiW